MPSPDYTLLAINNTGTVFAGDTLDGGTAPGIPGAAEGLLANDRIIYSDGSTGNANFPVVYVYDVTISGTTFLAQTFISDSYGDWSFYKEGVYHLIANGVDVKKLAEGQVASIVVPYTIASDNGTSAQADLIVNVIGRYDPPEVSLTSPQLSKLVTESNWFTENQFNILTGAGKQWFGPTIRLDFADNNSQIVVNAFIKAISSTGPAGMITDSSVIASFLQGEIQTGVDPGPAIEGAPPLYRPYFKINTDNFDLLNDAEELHIVFAATVSDGKGTPQTVDLGTLTIAGLNDAPFAHDDAVGLTSGQSMAVGSAGGVLSNDSDADSQHTLYVSSAGYGNQFQVMDPTGPQGSVTIQGTYLSLELFRDGSYVVHDNRQYTDLRTPWTEFTEVFTYRIQDDRGAPGVNDAQLAVHVLPDTESHVVQSLTNSVFSISEDDGGSVVLGMKTIDVDIEPIRVFSKANDLSDIALKFYSVSDSNSLHADQTLGQPQLALLQAYVVSLPVTTFEQITGPNLGTVWRADMAAGLHIVSAIDPGTALSLGYSLDMLNEGEQVELTYSLVAAGSVLDQQFIKLIITGKNDAPYASDLADEVYANRTIHRVSGEGLLTHAFDIDSADHVSLIYISADSVAPGTPGVHADEVAPGFDAVIAGLYGTLTVRSDGSYVYVANQDAVQGIQPSEPSFDSFTYTVSDLHGSASSAHLHIRVFSPQDLPVPADDDLTVNLDGVSASDPIGNVLQNDNVYDRNLVHVRWDFAGVNGFQGDDHGALYIDPSVFIGLRHGEHRDVEFSYMISNDSGESGPASVTVHLVGSNEAPVASGDTYFYQNNPGSVFTAGAGAGGLDSLLSHHDIGESQGDVDPDGDTLNVSAISTAEGGDALALVNGQAVLHLNDNITITVHADGQFSIDTPDDYTGMVSFAYEISDGIASDQASVNVYVGGPATLAGHLMINEISLSTGSIVRAVKTDNGAAPDSILVGKASIELFNNSNQSISATELATVKLQIRGADGTLSEISFDQLTGLTADKNGAALNKLLIPAHGVLMLYEPGVSEFGTWALYQTGSSKTFITSGSYVGQAWHLGSTVAQDMAVNLAQHDTSIDFFAANGADTEGFSGMLGIAGTAAAGVPWVGQASAAAMQLMQFNAGLSSDKETVFARVDYTDSNNASDWATTTRDGLTIGNVNIKGTSGSPSFVGNPLDPVENLNAMQGAPGMEGQIVMTGVSGAANGGDSEDIIIGGSGDDLINGYGHDDFLEGNAGNDRLLGGLGGDKLIGDAGDDQLTGGSGRDLLTGGDGNDSFIYLSVRDSYSALADEIMDLQHGQDKIDLSAIDANVRLAGDQAFAWGGNAVQDKAYTLSWHEESGKTIVTADVTGDTVQELRIVLHGVGLHLQVTDFML